jgi:hypothetical protein
MIYNVMPLTWAKETYSVIQFSSPYFDDQHLVASNSYSLPSWLKSLPSFSYYLLQKQFSDESIMEMLSIEELPLGDHHHRSSFLTSLDVIEE